MTPYDVALSTAHRAFVTDNENESLSWLERADKAWAECIEAAQKERRSIASAISQKRALLQEMEVLEASNPGIRHTDLAIAASKLLWPELHTKPLSKSRNPATIREQKC